MSRSILHKASSRGQADHGWLKTHHSFSFANYYNPKRMQFGALRVLNDDWIAAERGFGMHPHDNMEIVTIPLEGELTHEDSMGNTAVIRKGDVQVMSAGTGIYHSEFNRHSSQAVSLFQIWVLPNKENVVPRYDQISLQLGDRHNKLQQIVSPNPNDAGVWIHQDAWFHTGSFDYVTEFDYPLQKTGNGVYVFVISGSLRVDGEELHARDAMGVWECDEISISILQANTELLLIEVPMD